jgi:hypothetical protein
MALHGTIEVNGHQIGTWSAVREFEPAKRAEKEDPETIYTYAWAVSFKDLEGNVRSKNGSLEHLYGDGALRLAGSVLAAAFGQVGDVPSAP